jgi:hypothetical protein
MRPDAFAAALPASYRNLYSAMNANLENFNTQRALIKAPQREKLEAYTNALRERRTGPTASERLYALGAAFLQPTPYKGVAGMLANVSPVLAEQQKARREAEEAQKELALKYDLDLEKMTAEERMNMLEGQTDLRSEILALAAKTGKKGNTLSRLYSTPSGTFVDDLGRPVEAPAKEHIDILVGRPDREQAIIDFNKLYRAGAAEAILREYGLEEEED